MVRLLSRWRWAVLIIFILSGMYLVTRLVNLTLLPIFTDEAIYIRWSQIGAKDANWRFISLVDGKQPMFIWITMVLVRLLPTVDPLFVGRLTSALAGAGSLVGIAILSLILFGKKSIAFWALVLYLLSPFSLLYDRMALYDSLVATFSLWNLILAVVLVKTLRIDIALLLGMLLGAGMLNKTSGFLSLYLLPLTLLLFDWGKKERWVRLVRWIALIAIAALVSQALYSVLRLSPLLHMVSQKDALFVYSFYEWIYHPLRFIEGNLRGMFDWLWQYLSIPVVVVASWLIIRRRVSKEVLLLFLWSAVPFVALAAFGRVLYPRFILFMTIPVLVLAACGWSEIMDLLKRKTFAFILLTLLLLPNIYTSTRLIIDPQTASIPKADLDQYVNDWPAGGGIREVIAFLRIQAHKEKIAVFTEGTFGLLPYAIELYLVDHPNVSIRGTWPIPAIPPQEIIDSALVKSTYMILNQTQYIPIGWPLELIAEYQKGTNREKKLRLFRVLSPGASTSFS